MGEVFRMKNCIVLIAAALTAQHIIAQESTHAAAIRAAMEKRDCAAVVDAVNEGMAAKDTETLHQAGRLFDGLGCVSVDKKRAASLYETAAKAGHAAAAAHLGAKYGLGEGVTQDYATAATWFRKAMPVALQAVPADADYSVGYTMTLVHVTRERLHVPADALDQSGVGAALLRFDPVNDKLSVDFERRANYTSGAYTSSARRTVWVAVTDAWSAATKAAPAPDRSRLSATEIKASIDMPAPERDKAVSSGVPSSAPQGGGRY